jgi:hypothetical protein
VITIPFILVLLSFVLCRAMKELECIWCIIFYILKKVLEVKVLRICSRVKPAKGLNLLVKHIKLGTNNFRGARYNSLLEGLGLLEKREKPVIIFPYKIKNLFGLFLAEWSTVDVTCCIMNPGFDEVIEGLSFKLMRLSQNPLEYR